MAFLFASSTPSARANDVVNLMWLECSHALITRHRDRITKVDAELEAQKKAGGRGKHHGGANPMTRRKLVHSLRAFLTSEEVFWADLIGKLITTYDVGRARAAARTLGLAVVPPSEIVASISTEASNAALALCQTALVFYGDLARYTELCRESSTVARRYERAAECYHQARLLAPSNGRPDNQLAVIASARKDSLAAAFHYMRAVAVRSGFETARSNLESTYRQAMSEHRSATVGELPSETAELGEATRKAIVVLIAMNVSDAAKDAQTTGEEYEAHLARTKTLLKEALMARALPSENIIKILLLVIGTSWDARLGGGASHRKVLVGWELSSFVDAASAKRRNELRLLEAVLEVLVVLFNVSTSMTEQSLDASLEGPRAEDPTATFASRISAPVRRIAPTLRIASIWLLGHLDLIDRASNKDAFWEAYAAVVNELVTAFAPDLLPTLPSGANLEEDFEVRPPSFT
jgi:hypothetical protein